MESLQALLFVGHGSRIREAQAQASEFITSCMKLKPVPIQEMCFLELASPSVPEGVSSCIERGATQIAIIPIFLLAADHVKKDIPLIIEGLSKQYPHVTFTYGQEIGLHNRMIDLLLERITEKGKPDPSQSILILVGRGSSDPSVIQSMEIIKNRLKNRKLFNSVETSYLAAAAPSFEVALEQASKSGYKKVYVLPYLLFTGILMKSMQKTVSRYTSTNQKMILCNYLGFHPILKEIISDRVEELLKEKTKKLN